MPRPKDADPDVLTVKEVARMLGIGEHTAYEAAGRGELPHRRVGRRLLFSRAGIEAWLQGKSA